MSTTTWNPADELSCVFSNTNHTATSNSGGNQGCRSHPTQHSSSKWYIEFTSIQQGSGGGLTVVGLGFSSDTLGNNPQLYVNVLGDVTAAGGGIGGNVGALVSGDRLGYAFDFSNNLWWVRRNGGAWKGTGAGSDDPVTGVAGRAINAGGLFYAMTHFQVGGGGNAATINAGDSAFVDAIPAGFLAWDAPPPPFTYGQSRIIT